MSPTPQTMTAVAVVLSILATVAVVGRFYARHLKDVGIKSDDWTVLLALVSQRNTEKVKWLGNRLTRSNCILLLVSYLDYGSCVDCG